MERLDPLILVIDDAPLFRVQLANTLRGCGFRVIEASAAAEGVDTFRAHRADIALVLGGARVHSLDGAWLAHALRQIDASVPIVILTANLSNDDRARYEQLHTVDVLLTRPVTPGELVTKIQKTLQAASRRAVDVPSRSSPQSGTPLPGVATVSPQRTHPRPPTAFRTVISPAFEWPPRPEDLAAFDIAVDTRTARAVHAKPAPPPKDLLEVVTVGTVARPTRTRTMRGGASRRRDRLMLAASAGVCGVALIALMQIEPSSARARPSTRHPAASGWIAAVPASRLLGPTTLIPGERVRTRPVAGVLHIRRVARAQAAR